MTMISIGDLAQNLVLQHRGSALKTSVATLTQELASGTVKDVAARLGGDHSYLTDIESRLTKLDAFDTATSETRLFAEAAQVALSQLQDTTVKLGSDLLSSVPTTITTVLDQSAERAGRDLEAAISLLNGAVAGQSLFAGTATDRSPLADAGSLLDGLRIAVSGAATAEDIRIAADAWFSGPAGFESQVYQGAATSLAAVSVGAGQLVDLPLRADDVIFRNTLKGLALAALSSDAALGLDATTRNELLRDSGETMLSLQSHLSGARSGLGDSQARIEEIAVRNAAERSALTLARNTLLEADPYETAVRLADAQFRLESLYAATVRTAQLSLVRFLS